MFGMDVFTDDVSIRIGDEPYTLGLFDASNRPFRIV